MENYLLLKSLHLLGVVIFLGNIIVTAVWKIMANRTLNAQTIAFSQRLITLTDIMFTTGGVILILVTGRLMAAQYGGIDGAKWINWGWWLFILSGFLWVVFLIPIQIMQSRMAKEFSNRDKVPNRYWVLSRWWTIIGTIATIIPMANLYFMVFKPL